MFYTIPEIINFTTVLGKRWVIIEERAEDRGEEVAGRYSAATTKGTSPRSSKTGQGSYLIIIDQKPYLIIAGPSVTSSSSVLSLTTSSLTRVS